MATQFFQNYEVPKMPSGLPAAVQNHKNIPNIF